jgi:hypothetical protein
MKALGVTMAALLAASPPAATVPNGPPAPERTFWEVKWDDALCSLTRRHTGEHPFSFGLEMSPAARLMHVQLHYQGRGPSAYSGPVRLKLIFTPGGAPVPITFFGGPDGRRYDLFALTEADLLGQLAGARSLTLAGGHPYVTIDLGDSAKAVAALQACREEVLRGWGIDRAALDALRQLPEIQTPPSFEIEVLHRPKGAPPGDRRPPLLARVDVTRDGRVTDCAIVLGSRGADRDAKVCDLWRRNARFKPAIGADGAPVAARVVVDYIWTIP